VTSFRAVNLALLADALLIVVGLVGFLVARLTGHDHLVPVFGGVLAVGVLVFAGFLAVGLAVGTVHTVHWVVRTAQGRPPPGWG